MIHRTRFQLVWSFPFHSVNKILYPHWYSKPFPVLYHMKAYSISFRAMYNTWGQNLRKLLKKIQQVKKSTQNLANLRSLSLSTWLGEGLAIFFSLLTSYLEVYSSLVWYWTSKWATRKLGEGWIVQVSVDLVKLLTANCQKSFISLKTLFFPNLQ